MSVANDIISFNSDAERRLSILSIEKQSIKSHKNDKSKEDLAPPDPYHLTHFVLFFLSLGQLIPVTFFAVAQDYWMYKFRDISSEYVDLNNKTQLQKNFLSLTGLVDSIPMVIIILLSAYYGHKINMHTRFKACYTVLFTIFVIYTAFVKINTDTWQFPFFVMTIIVSTGISVSTALLALTNSPMIARFPLIYMKTSVYGGSASGLISALLQILCLKLGGSSTSVALIYFLIGTTILAISLVCAYTCKYIPRFAYYLGDTVADTKRPPLKIVEMKNILKKLWPYLITLCSGLLFAGMGGNNITTLVVPEGYGSGPWADKYFEPVITFLLPEIFGLLGRYFAAPLLRPKTAIWFVLADFTRLLLTEPLLLFCNAQPRKHLPVWFPHDWEYTIILNTAAFVRTFFTVSAYLSMPNLLGDKAEHGFILIATVAIVQAILSSVLSTFWVNMI